nr:S-layer homology domain-containing protein [uncultured Oscillibacter sp.]
MERLQRAFACLLLCALLAGAASVPAAALSDVPEDLWAKEAIDRCMALHYLEAGPDGAFGVGREMSRSEFVTALCRVLGWEPASPARAVYADVSEKEPYAGAVETAYRQGALTSQDGDFRPDAPITRSETAAMLVRALGYGTIAGLAQDTPLPFQDVEAGSGYIAMAYSMGLMDGASDAAFSPDGHVTREQAAVLLMRLHDKLREPDTGRIGIAVRLADLPDLKGYEAVGIAAAVLAYNGEPQLSSILSRTEAAAICSAVTAAGSKPLLYVTGGPYHVREGEAELLAKVLLEAVRTGGYAGLFLNASGLTTAAQRDELTAAARLLREQLGGKLLYIGAEGPSRKDESFGYDYAALGEAADRLVLRFERRAETVGANTAAPLEPLERIYDALSFLRGVVGPDKLALLLTSTGSEWDGKESLPHSGGEIAALLEEQAAQSHRSSRYACTFLTQEEGGDIWYLDAQDIRARAQLVRLFGGGYLCLSDLNDALPEVLEAMP